MIVEDEDSIRKFVRVNLEMENYVVAEAESGEKAIELYDSFKPDIVLLDIMLPG
ncbi:MAG: response regulator, partial [Neofamilia sp.]